MLVFIYSFGCKWVWTGSRMPEDQLIVLFSDAKLFLWSDEMVRLEFDGIWLFLNKRFNLSVVRIKYLWLYKS